MRPDRVIRNHFGIAVPRAGFEPALGLGQNAGLVEELDADDAITPATPPGNKDETALCKPLSIFLGKPPTAQCAIRTERLNGAMVHGRTNGHGLNLSIRDLEQL